mgnify:CR=1 FL=1
MQPKELLKQLKGKQPPMVVDVRSGMEYRAGHLPGALHLPLWKVLFRMTGVLPQDKARQLVLYCESGPRADLVGSMLAKRGYLVRYLDGDMAGWRKSGLPLEKA